MGGKPHPKLRLRPLSFAAPQWGQWKIGLLPSSSITSRQKRQDTRRRNERRSALRFDHREIHEKSVTATIDVGGKTDGYIVPPALGDRTGVLGALALAQRAVVYASS